MQTRKTQSNNHWLLIFLWHHKWWLTVAMVIAGIASYVATLFATPYYAASAVVYPAGGQQESDLHLKQGNTLLLLQLLESSFVADSVIAHFHLAQHYQIDTSTRAGKTELLKTYNSNTDFERTLYKSVRITVKDQDADFAAKLANGIVEITNHINQKIYRQNTREKKDFFEEDYRRKLEEVQQLTESLTRYHSGKTAKVMDMLRSDLQSVSEKTERQRNELKTIRKRFQVHDLNSHLDNIKRQYDEASTAYLEAKARKGVYEKYNRQDSLMMAEVAVERNRNRKERLKKQLDKLMQAESEYNWLTNKIALNRRIFEELRIKLSRMAAAPEPELNTTDLSTRKKNLEQQLTRLGQLKSKYEHARSQYNQPVPAAYMFSRAKPDYEIVYPQKILIVGGAVVLTFLLTLSILLIFRGHAYRDKA